MPLNLSRRARESVILRVPDGAGGWLRIVVQVAALRGQEVMLCIDAPQAVEVMRKEIAEAVEAEGWQRRGKEKGREKGGRGHDR